MTWVWRILIYNDPQNPCNSPFSCGRQRVKSVPSGSGTVLRGMASSCWCCRTTSADTYNSADILRSPYHDILFMSYSCHVIRIHLIRGNISFFLTEIRLMMRKDAYLFLQTLHTWTRSRAGGFRAVMMTIYACNCETLLFD